VRRNDRRRVAQVRAEQQVREPLQGRRQRDGDQHAAEVVLLPLTLVAGEPPRRHQVEEDPGRRADDQEQHEAQGRRQACRGGREQPGQHDDPADREVHDLRDPEDEGRREPDQGVQRPQPYSVDERLQLSH
jgi:hypothetical protein